MALSLVIIPMLLEKVSDPIAGNIICARDYLRFWTNSAIFPYVIDYNTRELKIETNSLPPNIKVRIPNGERYITTKNDFDGKKLRYTYAKTLKQIPIPPNTHYIDKAIMAYIHELPDETEILLFWD